ncbi:TetR/AcrR family transcriptional regulator [uncultured Mycolicibacterium sp.]|uniref:TetR/AcrR family transcriptional regulator n=1 Tax=uncultured Mycolicibacterium sp. TaxID=2320817 RepID=UPI002615E1EA|nr:TetR/AcrR family transcriptional regulator [uncultured Mycolicibacterium sp.]
MVERWTRQRRMEHTRALLIDAAEEVFARKGFGAASLDDIADAAGYTKGAIYKHFATKEDLFLAVSDKYWRRYFEHFTEVLARVTTIGEPELDEIARRWRDITRSGGADHAALGHEFTLYLRRNPAAAARVADRRRQVVADLTDFIVAGVERLGATLRIPAETFARVLITTGDGIMLGSELDGVDLHRAALQMYLSVIELPDR